MLGALPPEVQPGTLRAPTKILSKYSASGPNAILLQPRILLGAHVPGWTLAEERLTSRLPTLHPDLVDQIRKQIQRGQDPLGELLTSLRPARERRHQGATYTPANIVLSMLSAIAPRSSFARVVDPGAGSARFLLAAGADFDAPS